MRLAVALVLAGVCSFAWAEPTGKPLYGIAKDMDTSKLFAQDGSCRLVPIADGFGIELKTMADKAYPTVHFPAPQGTWDLSAAQGIEATVTNTDTVPLTICLRVDNPGDWTKNPWNSERADVIPGETKTIRVTFGESWGQPGYPLDASKVADVLVFGGADKQPRTFVVRDIRPFGTARSQTASTGTASKLLYDFVANVDTAKLREQGATVRAIAVDGGYGLELTTQPNVEYPGVNIPAPGGAWDLSAYQGVEMIVTNTGTTPTSAVLRVDNGGDWQKEPYNGEAEHGIPADETRTVRVTFGKSWGHPGYALDSSKVVNLLIMAGKSAQPQTIVIRSLRPFGIAVKPETPVKATYPATVDFEKDGLFNLIGGQITTDKAEVISGTRSLLGDARGQERSWFEFATTRLGMFAPGYKYTVHFKYRVLHAEPDAKFYALLRSRGQGWGTSDRAWTDMKDLKTDPTAVHEGTVDVGLDTLDDYQLMFGLKGAVRVAIDDIQITQGQPFSEPDPIADKIKAIPAGAERIASFDFEQPKDGLSVAAPGAATEDAALVMDGKRSLLIDSLTSNREWNTSAVLKPGTLEGGYRYYVYLKYRPISWGDDSSFGYMFFKRTVPKVDQDTITARQWRGTAGRNGVMYHRLEVPKGEMAYMELGIFKKGKMVVDDLVVMREPLGVKAIDTRVPLQRTDANLIWREEFDSKQIDPAKWTISQEPRRGGMWAKDHALLDGEGNLVLQFDKDKSGRYEMGALNTDGKFSFKYGYVEARMKLPKQTGHWPGVWLMGSMVNSVGNEGQDGTEVDIVECPWRDKNRASHALHWDGYGMEHQQVGQLVEIPGLNEGWHTYAVDWSEAGYIFLIDGRETWRTDAGGSCRNPLFIILSDEMGGWSGDPNQAKDLPDKTYIDYVRVWQEKPAKQ